MQLLGGLSPRFIMNSRPLLASFLCASLVSLAPAAAHAQLSPAGLSAAGQLATALSWEAEPVNTSVLGLRSGDAEAGEELTLALRKAFAEREMSGGQEMSLEEVILTLDCSSEQDTECMTEAGRALETERLVYGTLGEDAGGYILDIIVLDVSTGQVEAQATLPLETDSLAAANLGATATEVVNSLYPKADPSVIAPVPTGEIVEKGDETIEDEDDTPKSGLVWGPYKPRPGWKKAGLGIGATLLVGGVVTGIVGGVMATSVIPQRVEDASNEANADSNPANDIRPANDAEEDELARAGKGSEQCDIAFLPGALRNPNAGSGVVVNGKVANLCQDGKYSAIAANVGWAVAGVGAATTIAFTILYFVHRDKPEASARKRTFRLTGGPMRGGTGAMVGGVGRF